MDPFLWLVLLILLIFLVNATAEAASQLLKRFKLQMLLDSYRQRSGIARLLLPQDSAAMLAILSCGRSFSIAALVLAIIALTAQPLEVWLGTTIAATLVALYLPSLLAMANPAGVLNLLLPVTMIINIVLLPLTWPLRILLRRTREKMRLRGADLEEEEEAQHIAAYLDTGQEEGLLEPGEAELVRQVVEFGETVVKEVMTPRVDMVCIDRSDTLQAFLQLAAEHKFSRFPVVEGMIDNVVGIAHIKSVLGYTTDQLNSSVVAEVMSPPAFVPESKYVHALLRDFQQNNQQMAIVVDEYGGTAGLITLEDILEEIVGEIEDEHYTDDEENDISEESDGSIIVAGYVDVDEVEELLGAQLDDEAFETVSGMALSHLKHFPKVGETFTTRGVEVEVLEADEKSILKLRMKKVDEKVNNA